MSACSGNCAHRKVETEETDGSSSRQEGVDLALFVPGSAWSRSEKKISFPPWPRKPWQKDFGLVNGEQGKKDAWRKQIFEVHSWRQVRGLAEGVLCESSDLGIYWPLSLPTRCGEDVSETGQNNLVEEVGSQTRA